MNSTTNCEEITCNTCNTPKQRIQAGYVSGQVRFIDERGKTWHRRKCPDCRIARAVKYNKARAVQTAKREKSVTLDKVLNAKAVYVAPGTKTYPCGKCSQTTVNRFYCSHCYTQMRHSGSPALLAAEFLYGR